MHRPLSQVKVNLARFRHFHKDTLVTRLGMELVALGPDFLIGEMPVDQRTMQPFGLLHGGASIALAETLGSTASAFLVTEIPDVQVVGVEVSGCHVRGATQGKVTGICKPLRIGRSLHFWKIDIYDEQESLCCAARLTVSIGRKKPNS